MITNIINPFGVTIKDVIIKKFGSSSAPTAFGVGDIQPMSIKPQVVEFVLYQSIFSPILKAQLAIYDAVNLLNNYPLVGEEYVDVNIEQQGARYSTEKMNITLKFIIAGITNVEFGANGRDQTYFIELHSVEAFENAKRKVSKAYRSGIVETSIKDVLTNYLRTTKPLKIVDATDQTVDRTLVVPNLRPFSAITWLTKMSVPSDPTKQHNFVFYETVYNTSSRFVYKSFQKQLWRDSIDESAIRGAENHPFFYISNYETVNSSVNALEKLQREGFEEERLILNLKINKRYSVLEKIIGGYFENEYVEINLDAKDYFVTRTTVNDSWKQLHYKNHLQTKKYIDDVINTNTEKETSPRVKYAFLNYDSKQDPRYSTRWGFQEVSKLATSQIDLSIDIHTNLQIVPGELIYLNIPEMHGYEESKNDRYLTGLFYITESKMTIRTTGETTMLLRVNKDSYFQPINLNMNYVLE